MSGKRPDPMELPEMELQSEEPQVSQQAAPFKPSLRTEWREDEKSVVQELITSADAEIRTRFAEAFQVERKFLSKVRTPELDEYGNVKVNPDGSPIWRRNPDGTVLEDWSLVTLSDMDEFVMNASAWAFFGAQDSVDIWAEAVVAKLMLDEEYDAKYSSMVSGTIADKQARASRHTQDSRYFAAYLAILDRKAKEVVSRLDQTVRRVENIRNQRTRELTMKLPK